EAVRSMPDCPTLVILDLSAAPHVDVQSAEALAGLADELSGRGIRIHAVEARASVRDRLRAAGVDAKLGGINRFSSIADVLDNVRLAGRASGAETLAAGVPPVVAVGND